MLPPRSNPDAASISPTILNQLCYQYRYDGRKRLIEKRVPGKGWDYYVYNQSDRPVLNQDSVQRIAGRWTFTKYDVFGREVMTGLYANTSSRTNLQTTLNAENVLWETPVTTGIGYTNVAFPQSISSYLTIQYYDNYSFPGASNYSYAGSNKTSGLLTGSLTYALGSTNVLLNVNYYDNEGRIAKTYRQHFQSGSININNYDEISNTYYFEGGLTASNRIHHNASSGNTTIAMRYEYDHVGRKLYTYEKINNSAEVLLAENRYNEIGQLKDKAQGDTIINNRKEYDHVGRELYTYQQINTDPEVLLVENHYNEIGQLKEKSQGDNKQSTTFAYNERGWLTQKSAPLFAMQLKYNDGTLPRFNGDIANQLWGTPGNLTNNFTYNYDALGRFISGDTGTGIFEKDIAYDVMGNILTLNRNGTGVQNYTYNPTVTGSRLNNVNGGATRTYSYDVNGNSTGDNTNTITYNLLNLPEKVSGRTAFIYTYDAIGRKLRSVIGGITTHYVDGI